MVKFSASESSLYLRERQFISVKFIGMSRTGLFDHLLIPVIFIVIPYFLLIPANNPYFLPLTFLFTR